MSYPTLVLPASGTTWAQFLAGGLSAMIERLITVIQAAASVAPTAAPTLAASGSGATLPAASYFIGVTETNGIGETTLSPSSLVQAITLGQNLVVTYPALQTGNTARNTYWSLASTGPWALLATGTTAAALTISAPLPANSYAVAPPTSNGTALSSQKLSMLRSFKDGNLAQVAKQASNQMKRFISGDPIAFNDQITKGRDGHIVFAMLAQIHAEALTLIDANPGTLTTKPSLLNAPTPVRTWP